MVVWLHLFIKSEASTLYVRNEDTITWKRWGQVIIEDCVYRYIRQLMIINAPEHWQYRDDSFIALNYNVSRLQPESFSMIK